MLDESEKNDALEAEDKYKTAVESANDYIENFDILETITNVGNDEVFTPRKTCDMILDSLPEEVWHNPNYKWLNPATKNGIFEREIAIRLDDGLKDIIPDTEQRRKHILQNMIYSIGQTRFTANVARRTVYYCSQANRKCDGIKADDGHYVNGYAIGNGSWFDDEEGNIKTPNINHTFVDDKGETMPSSCSGEEKKKYRCKYCGINGASAYNDANQRETYAYEFIHFDGDELLKHLQDRFFGGNRNMKFDIIIGNPPYQLSTNDKGGIQAIPIYNKFVEQAFALKPKYISMIIPSRWYTGGMGMDSFRNAFLSNDHIELLFDFPKSRDCFSNVDIAGGVCFFLWSSSFTGDCRVISSIGGKNTEKIRKLNQFDVFVRSNIGVEIINKIRKKANKYLNEVVASISPFGLSTNVKGKKNYFAGSVKLISSSGESFIQANDVPKGKEYIDEYKISIGQLNPDRGGVNNASDGKSNVTTKVKIYEPNEVFTATYLLLNHFKVKEEAENFAIYIKTKFVRYLVNLTLSSMHITKDNFRFVPTMEFSRTWTDNELYSYFDLNDEEIKDIESTIREMK